MLLCLTVLVLGTYVATGQGINIATGGSIDATGASSIFIQNGSFVNDGTFTASSSNTVILSGTTVQAISGSSATTFYNLTIDSSVGDSLKSSALTTVSNALTINSGKKLIIPSGKQLTVSGNITNSAGASGLVIKSKVTGSGSLISTSSVAATVEQYQTDSSYIYHMVSAPVTSATAAVFKFTGVQTYLYSYNPAVPAWANITTSATALNVGQGYLVNYHNMAVDRTVTYSGTLNADNISPALSTTSGKFNLVGNPYPCAINWDGSGWTKTGISGTYYLWLPAKGSYGTYATSGAVSVNGLKNIIPSGQGFFVFSTAGSPVLTIGNAAKIQNSSILKSGNIVPPMVKLHVSNNANTFSDETVIMFSPQATTGYDADLDAIKMLTLDTASSQIYTLGDNKNLVINAMPVRYSDSIPLFFKCNKAATYTIELIENTWSDSVTLTDLISNKTTLLSGNPYIFSALKTDTSRRFVINHKKSSSSPTGIADIGKSISDVQIYSDGRKIYLKNKLGRELNGEMVITGITGAQVYVEKNIWLVSDVVREVINIPGIYIVTFKAEHRNYIGKVIVSNF